MRNIYVLMWLNVLHMYLVFIWDIIVQSYKPDTPRTIINMKAVLLV